MTTFALVFQFAKICWFSEHLILRQYAMPNDEERKEKLEIWNSFKICHVILPCLGFNSPSAFHFCIFHIIPSWTNSLSSPEHGEDDGMNIRSLTKSCSHKAFKLCGLFYYVLQHSEINCGKKTFKFSILGFSVSPRWWHPIKLVSN